MENIHEKIALIYDKISNHFLLNKSDIIKLINLRLIELNLYKRARNVVFTENDEDYMWYDSNSELVGIHKNIRAKILFSIIEDAGGKLKIGAKSSFLKDAFNLELLLSLFHELRHAEQYNILLKKNKKYYHLLQVCLNFMQDSNYYDTVHDMFLSEYDAELSAALSVLYDIEEGRINNISDKNIYYFNKIMSLFILHSRGYEVLDEELKKVHFLKSPLQLIYFIVANKYNKTENPSLKYIIDIIKEIKCNNKSEYDRLLTGDNLNEETINQLYLIASGKIKTKNIFKYFENIEEKEKVNIHSKILKYNLFTTDKK